MESKQTYLLSKWLGPVFVTPDQASHWFGYYNHSPLDIENRRLLAHRVNFDGRAITAEDMAEVGWFDLKDGTWHSLGETRAFNWQQGAMLQWLGPDFCTRAIYNDVGSGHFVARVVDLEGDEQQFLRWPVYAVLSDGKTAISLQFERSYWFRAYHYESVVNPAWDVPIHSDDGIFSVNLETGVVQRIIALEDIRCYEADGEGTQDAAHWLEHIMANPSGTRFAFYHRFGRGENYRTRVFTADCKGGQIYLIPGWRDAMYSHLGWRTDDELALFTSMTSSRGRTYEAMVNKGGWLGTAVKKGHQCIKDFFPRRVAIGGSPYMFYTRIRDGQGPLGRFAGGRLSMDGHPSFTSDGRFMLADTYADCKGYRRLLLFDTRSERLLELGRFFSPYNCCGHRCDLHPRFSRDGSMVVIDSAHSGRHQMMVLRLDWTAIADACHV